MADVREIHGDRGVQVSVAEPILVTRKQLLGAVAHWATRLSPYPHPEGLASVLAEVDRRWLVPWPRWEDGEERPVDVIHRERELVAMVSLPRNHRVLRLWLEGLLFDQPEVKAWNARKNGREGMGFASRYGSDASGPDDDFVDLDALTQNIAMSLLAEDAESRARSERRVGS